MGNLEKLKLVDATWYQANTPEAAMRAKMVDALNRQIEAAEAMLKGELFQRRRQGWVEDTETGTKVLKDLPVRFRPRYWRDEKGGYLVEIRYGNKRLELKPKLSTVQVGAADNLVPTLALIRDAVLAGELDKQLEAAKGRYGKKLKP